MSTTLPYSDASQVTIHVNENLDNSTINRPIQRLLKNDETLLDSVNTVVDTTIGDGLTGALGGTLGVDIEHISKNIQIDATKIKANIKLANLCDVVVDQAPADGSPLIYSKALGKYTTGTSDNDNENNNLIRPKFTTITNNSCLDVEGQIDTVQEADDGTGRQIVEFAYDVKCFNNNWTVDYSLIDGFWVYVRNFGRTDLPVVGAAKWSTEAKLPSGEWYEVNGHYSLNNDDDGGTSQLVYIPWNYDASVDGTLRLRLDLFNNKSSTLTYTDTNNSNYFKIVGCSMIDSQGDVIRETVEDYLRVVVDESELVATNVAAPEDPQYQQGAQGVLGGINATTVLETGVDTWSSNEGSLSDLVSTFPINAGSSTDLTIVKFSAALSPLTTTPSGSTAVDAGTDTDNTVDGKLYGHVEGSIRIDWRTGSIKGFCNIYNGIVLDKHEFLKIEGTVDTTINVDENNYKLKFHAEDRAVHILPFLSFNDGGAEFITRNITYTIQHHISNIGYFSNLDNVVTIDDTTVDGLAVLSLHKVLNITQLATYKNVCSVNDVVYVLPLAVTGKRIRLINDSTKQIKFVANGSDTMIEQNGTALGVGVEKVAAGSPAMVELYAINSSTWQITNQFGTWV